MKNTPSALLSYISTRETGARSTSRRRVYVDIQCDVGCTNHSGFLNKTSFQYKAANWVSRKGLKQGVHTIQQSIPLCGHLRTRVQNHITQAGDRQPWTAVLALSGIGMA